jgi:putative MATE family efflux protein
VTQPQPREARLDSRLLLRLSAAAFVVLAAEPLFVLVDTAVVGHLGSVPIGGLGVAGTLLSLIALAGAFLDYGTTARAARWFGAGQRDAAVDEGVSATWLGVAIGIVGVLLGELLAGPLLRLLGGGSGAVVHAALDWFRIAVLGLPGMLIILAGNGWMRGVQETRRPVRIVLLANALSAVASPVLVYPLGLGLRGSAVANVTAQTLAGVLFVVELYRTRRPWRPRRAVVMGQLVSGRDLLVRKLGFQVALLTAAAVAARMGTAQVAAHSIGLECWEFTALLLDSFAIAAQSLVGAALGGSDAGTARALARQVGRYGLAAGAVFAVLLAAGWAVIPLVFTSADAVRHQLHLLWPLLVGIQPAAGVVFALDGVLLGAGDVRFLRTLTVVATAGVYAPLALAALWLDWGVAGIWAGLAASILVRLAGMLLRTRSERWVVLGTS